MVFSFPTKVDIRKLWCARVARHEGLSATTSTYYAVTGADASAPIYVMFFDGGSRGNPGPGGSGAVIIRTDYHATMATIIWSAATWPHTSTTNNQAEYVGALKGLRAAHKHQWLPLDVVGDSQLILRQLMKYNGRLAVLYAEARRLADRLGIQKWHHHLRVFNKMTDAAANAAMIGQALPCRAQNEERRWCDTFH